MGTGWMVRGGKREICGGGGGGLFSVVPGGEKLLTTKGEKDL